MSFTEQKFFILIKSTLSTISFTNCVSGVVSEKASPLLVQHLSKARGGARCSLSFAMPPKDDEKKKDAKKLAKKDKDPVNKSGGKAKKKVGVESSKSGRHWGRRARVAVVINDVYSKWLLRLWRLESED